MRWVIDRSQAKQPMDNHQENNTNHRGIDGVIRSLINDEKLRANLWKIAADFQKELQSKDFGHIVKVTLLGLAIAELLTHCSITKDHPQDLFHEQRRDFIKRYKIKERDLVLITFIVKGKALRHSRDVLNISESNANKKIRNLWQRLKLDNREQLVFIAGWMRLISPELGCLKEDA